MEKQKITISQQELIVLLNQVEKSTMVNILMETEVGMKKTDNPYYKKVIKRSSCNYLIGNEYEVRVDGNYRKEGLEENFQVQSPSGKKHISKCVLVDTKTESVHYLMVERFDEIKPQVEYFFEGNPIDKTLFEGYMNKVYESQKQECERKVMVITPKIENIKEITLNKVRYIVG